MSQMRIVAIDYGLARIGMALSDPSQLIATPLPTLLAEKKLEKTVEKLVALLAELSEEKRCAWETIVVGFPLLLSGKKGHLADEVDLFIALLEEKIASPIFRWDERLTSAQAEKLLRQDGLSRKKRAQAVDSVAALVLLQNYLDWKNRDTF